MSTYMFYKNVENPQNSSDEEWVSLCLSDGDYSEISPACLDQVIPLAPTFTLKIYYPLENPYERLITPTAPLTVRELLVLFDQHYRAVYLEEDASNSPDDANIIRCQTCQIVDLKLYEKLFKFERLNSDICSICMSSRTSSKLVLPCKHKYHFRCMDKWFKRKNECPLCKAPVVQCDDCKSTRYRSIVDLIPVEENSRAPSFGQYRIGPLHYEDLVFIGLQYDEESKILNLIDNMDGYMPIHLGFIIF